MKSRCTYLTLALVALTLLGGAFACESLLLGWFGPPRVELREAYAADDPGVTVDHSAWNDVVAGAARSDGSFDYELVRRDPGRLLAYLRSLAEVDLDALGRDQRLALLINAYNAFTVQLILEHWGVESIRDIPAGERWDAVRWNLGGRDVSLSQIEHELLRANFVEPRIHFAINCASVGCPPLRAEAYAGGSIDQQLEDQTRRMHADPRWFELTGDRLRLTQLYRWYEGDFVQVAGSTLAFAARHAPGLAAALAAGRQPEVSWIDYDWSLNAVR